MSDPIRLAIDAIPGRVSSSSPDGNIDVAGSPVWRNAAVTDINERKRAGMALSLSEERYARAMEAAEEGHWEWAVTTDEIFLSPRAKEMLGFAPDARFANRTDRKSV